MLGEYMIDKRDALNLIKNLLLSQPLGILATESVDGIHTSLIPFSYDEFHECIFFCASENSSEFQNIEYTNSVSLLVHNNACPEKQEEHCSVSVQGFATVLRGERQECANLQLRGAHDALNWHFTSPCMQSLALQIHSYELVQSFRKIQRIVPYGS